MRPMIQMKILLAGFVLASLTLPLVFERQSSAQQADRGQGVKPVGAAKPERRVALVIGNGNYAVRPLANPPNDARALAVALKDLGFEVISGENLKRAEMQQKLRAFEASLRGSTVGLFFFAGHGVQVNGVNYLIPIGADIETETDVDAEAVSANQVLSRMYAADNPINLVILDACRDNPFRGFKRSGARGLAQLRALSGTLIAYATAPDDTAADGTGSNSPYTTEILQHIRTPGLKIEDFFKRVRLGVETRTNRQQTPWESSSLRGDFYFVAPPPERKDDRPTGEYAFWRAIEDSTDPQDFRDFLEKHPNSEYANAARVRLRRLTPRPEPPATTPGSGNSDNSTSAPPPVVSTLPSFNFETVRLDKSGKETSRTRGQKNCLAEDIGNGVKLEMVEIPGGTFQMGSTEYDSEKPVHSVTVSSFWMGRFEVTQAQWQAVMGNNPSNFKGDGNLPVENVSWNDVQEFLKKLNAQPNLQGKNYRLPTEAEWEYAARAGTTTPFAFGETITPQIVNYDGNNPYARAPKGTYRRKTVPVGSLGVANVFGLFDMHGNVWEWCEDWYGTYSSGSVTNPTGPATGSYRVIRGGGWGGGAVDCRSADRSGSAPGNRVDDRGFRLVRIGR